MATDAFDLLNMLSSIGARNQQMQMTRQKFEWDKQQQAQKQMLADLIANSAANPIPSEVEYYNAAQSAYDDMINQMFARNADLGDTAVGSGGTTGTVADLISQEPMRPTAPVGASPKMQAILENLLMSNNPEALDAASKIQSMLSAHSGGRGKSYGPSSLTDALGTREGAFMASIFPEAVTDPAAMEKALQYRAEQFADPEKKKNYLRDVQAYTKALADQGFSNFRVNPTTQAVEAFNEMTQQYEPVPGTSGRGAAMTTPDMTADEIAALSYMADINELNKMSRDLWMPKLTGPLQGTWNTMKTLVFDDPEFQAWRDASEQRIILAYGMSGKQISEKEIKQILGRFLPSKFMPDENLAAREWALNRFVNASIYNKLKTMEGRRTLGPEDRRMMEEAKANMADSKINIFGLANKKLPDGEWGFSSADGVSIENAIKREMKNYPGATSGNYKDKSTEELLNTLREKLGGN